MGSQKQGENRAQPPGWAVPETDTTGTYQEQGKQAEEEYEAGEAQHLDRHVPTNPGGYQGVNPAQPGGYEYPNGQMAPQGPRPTARVYRQYGKPVVGSRVILSDGEIETHVGHVAEGPVLVMVNGEQKRRFLAAWNEGEPTWEDTDDYEVVPVPEQEETDGGTVGA